MADDLQGAIFSGTIRMVLAEFGASALKPSQSGGVSKPTTGGGYDELAA
jgi:hypothetical protein